MLHVTHEVEDFDVLVEDLNKSQNFSAFVRSMRQRFKQLCGPEEAGLDLNAAP